MFDYDTQQNTGSIRTIHFLSAGSMIYRTPVLDPLFLTTPSPNPPPTAQNTTVTHAPAGPLTILVCNEIHTFCSPIDRSSRVGAPLDIDGRVCNPHLPTDPDSHVFDPRIYNPAQIATGKRLRNAIPSGGIASTIQALKQPLAVSRTAFPVEGSEFAGGYEQTAEIPGDQWRVEVTRWLEISMVMMQMSFREFAAGPGSIEGDERVLFTPVTEADGELFRGCGTQRVRGVPGARNMNLAGIIGTVAVGLFLVGVSLLLEPVVGWLQRRKLRGRGGQTGVMLWKMDGLLQMQRLMFEAAGVRGWDGEGAVPTTAERVFLKDVHAMRMRSTF